MEKNFDEFIESLHEMCGEFLNKGKLSTGTEQKPIPELAESEDERIRKYFIWIVKNIFDNIQRLKLSKEQIRELFDNYAGIKVSDMLAWLEKQKEPLTPEEKMNHRLYLEGFDVGKKVGETLKEQKPAEWDELQAGFRNINEAFEDGKKEVADNPERYGLYRPAEWSEEDEKTINDACCWIAEYAGYLMDKNYGKASMLMGLTDKLKSLRPVKPTEWSKEDEMYLSQAIEALEHENYIILADKLESLRSRPKSSDNWKPSEEQMEALKDAVKLYKDTHFERFHQRIESLHEQLKKLM